MLRVTIELVPHGDETRAREIGVMLIANDGEGTHTKGNYAYVYGYTDRRGVRFSTGTVKNFYRNQGAWALIKKILMKGNEEETILTDKLMNRLEYLDEVSIPLDSTPKNLKNLQEITELMASRKELPEQKVV
jgi:hypothetical protein